MLKLLNKYNFTIHKVLFTLVLLLIPLYPKFPLVNVPGTYVAIRLEDILMLIVGVYLLFNILPKVREIFSKDIEKSVLLFLLAGLTSVVSGVFVTKTVLPHIGLFHWVRRVEYFLPFFLGLTIPRTKIKEYVEYTIKLLFIVVLYIFIFGLGQKFLSWPVIITQNLEYSKGVALRYLPGSHLISTFAGHYDMASVMVVILPIIASTFFYIKKEQKLFTGIVFVMGLWLLSNSLSRISVAAYFVATGVSLLVARKVKAIPIVFLISIIILGFSSNLLDRYIRIFQVVRDRTASYELVDAVSAEDFPQRMEVNDSPSPEAKAQPVFEDRSASIRINVEWPRAIRAFSKNPLLGTGYSSITLATDNDFLRLLGEVGLVGTMAFFLIFANVFSLFKSKFSKLRSLKGMNLAFIAGMAGAFVGVFVNATFIDIFEASKFAIVYFLLLGLLVGVLRSINYEKNT